MFTVTLHPDAAPPLDLTPDVRSLEWRLGTGDSAQALAPPGRARITVYDPAGRYAPDAPEAYALLGRALTITRLDAGGETPHFSGLICAVHPLTGPEHAGQAIIEAVTADAGLSDTFARLPPLTGCAPGPLIAALLTELPLRRLTLEGAWVLEAPGFGELGLRTPLAGPLAMPVEADEGISRFAYAALGGLPAADALRQIVESEGGRCAAGRDGVLRFSDRHAPLRPRAPAASLDGTMCGLTLEAGRDWANQVTARFYPVRVGQPDTVLWSLDQSQKLPPGTRRVTVHFRDAERLPTAALTVARLEASATSEPDGAGSPLWIEAQITAADSRSAQLEFRNPGPANAWLTTGTRLLGTPLQSGAALEAEHIDPLSMAFHGPRRLALDLRLISELDEALSRARFTLLCAPEPRSLARQVELDARAVPAAPSLTLGDCLRVRDSPTGHDALYDVIGEAHTVDQSGARHRITLSLAPAPQTAFWVVGLRALDAGTTLAH